VIRIQEMVSEAVLPIDWLSEDNYSCHYLAGINSGRVRAAKLHIKSGAGAGSTAEVRCGLPAASYKKRWAVPGPRLMVKRRPDGIAKRRVPAAHNM
jgi:hypothetical protein